MRRTTPQENANLLIMYADKYVSHPKDIPDKEHWAIVMGSCYTDTSPDRGGSNYYTTYEVFLTKEKWEARITELMTGTYKKDFKALHVYPATIGIQVKVNVDETKKPFVHGF